MFLINLQPQFLSSQPIHPVEKTATRKLNKIFLDFFFLLIFINILLHLLSNSYKKYSAFSSECLEIRIPFSTHSSSNGKLLRAMQRNKTG